jgi:hypothetical protein
VKKTFVETRVFTERLKRRLDDETYRGLQQELMANPAKGAVMPGCGGLRKVRVSDPTRSKGKRGGARIIYLDIPEAERIDLITIYSKDEQDDLSAAEKRRLRQLVDALRAEAVAAFRRKGRRE